ncbi:MAG: hypothetical protein S4CHLAM6_07210 [Chlamydiae bacterium]|nr:hypothetical protein [Chlamydiota bacterium]
MKMFKNSLYAVLVAGSLFASASLLKADTSPVQPAQQEVNIGNNTELNSTIHELETLFVLMQERLALMHDLARYKWNNQLKDQTLKGETLSGQKDSEEVQSFLAAQNNAALEAQKQDFELFEKEGIVKFESIKDFKTEILPQLESLDEKILGSAQELMSFTHNESLPEFLRDVSFNSFKQEGVERSVYDIAVSPLFND